MIIIFLLSQSNMYIVNDSGICIYILLQRRAFRKRKSDRFLLIVRVKESAIIGEQNMKTKTTTQKQNSMQTVVSKVLKNSTLSKKMNNFLKIDRDSQFQILASPGQGIYICVNRVGFFFFVNQQNSFTVKINFESQIYLVNQYL